MQILVTADLHFEVARSLGPATELAERVCRMSDSAEALILVGDTFAFDPAVLSRSLHLFDGFLGRKLITAGNHDLWVPAGGDSRRWLCEEFAPRAAEAGFHLLDAGPTVIGGVAFVGGVGWYDYSFRRAELEIPDRFYAAKVSPGAAAIMESRVGLLAEDAGPAPGPRGRRLRARWMDGVHVRWDWTDEQFLARSLDRLEADIVSVDREVDTIVAAVHCVPLAELMPTEDEYEDNDRVAFAAAYFGSPRLGEVLLRHAKCRYIVCGHSHRARRATVGDGVTAVNVGSTYEEKQLVTLSV